MTDINQHFYLERPDSDQFLFSVPKKTVVIMGGVLVTAAIFFLVWGYSGPASVMRSAKGFEKLALVLAILLLLLGAGWNFYLAIVGRSFFIDGKTKMVSKNGERLTGFGGVRSVDLACGYHPSIDFMGRTYALSLRMKSGESVPIVGTTWRSWAEILMNFREHDGNSDWNNEEAAADLDELADEIAALMVVPVSKGAR